MGDSILRPWVAMARALCGLAVAAACAVPMASAASASEPDKSATAAPTGAATARVRGWALTAGVKSTPGGEARVIAPTPHFALMPGEALHPRVPAAGFSAVYSGDLAIDAAGSYQFGLESEGGAASLSVYDAAMKEVAGVKREAGRGGAGTMSNAATLAPGVYSVSVKFQRAGDAKARLRVLWSLARGATPGFHVEPIRSDGVSVPKFALEGAQAGSLALRGRVLLGELGCVHCHAAGAATGGHEHARADDSAVLHRVPPLLGDTGARFGPGWLRKWVLSPQDVKPGCGMPAVLGGSMVDAEAVVQFLVSNGGPTEFERAATEETATSQGRRLYHTVGCVNCHGALDSPNAAFTLPWQAAKETLSKEVPAAAVPAPLGALPGKWRPRALAEFLKDPLRSHPGGRMPNMVLSGEDADLIASYVVTRVGEREGAGITLDQATVARGREVFASRGCASCHGLSAPGVGVASTLRAKSLKELAADAKSPRGCLDPKDTKTPRYGLSDGDRAALIAGIAEAKACGAAPAPLDRLERTIRALKCTACHTRDGVGGVPTALQVYATTQGDAELGDEGRLPPNLTGVGWKLHTGWLRKVLTEAGRARAYMTFHMPQFGEAQVATLAHDLASEEGVWPDSDAPEPTSSDEMVAAGRALVGSEGLNCISCHQFGRYPLAGTPGPNILNFAERVRYEWWSAYIADPPRFKPGTRMPQFYVTGHGQFENILGGDPQKQANALWCYFSTGFAAPVPKGLSEASAGLQVRVGERAVVLRTFLKDGGSRAVAVGFPAGRHFAFDAAGVRLVSSWTGDFLDATGAWKNRGGEITGGRGATDWSAPDGPPLVIGVEPSAGWPRTTGKEAGYSFGGYRLDAGGVPTFFYKVTTGSGAASVEETIRPGAGGGGPVITRAFVISGHGGKRVYARAGKGTTIGGVVGASVEGAGGEPAAWFVVTPGSKDAVRFTLEITP